MYDTETGRFLSKDPFVTEGSTLDLNPYIYCGNNPLTRIDPDGAFWHIVAGAAIGGIISAGITVATQVASGKGLNGKQILKSFAVGAVGGAVFAATGGAGIIAASAASGGASSGASYLLGGGKKSIKGFAGSAAVGSAVGAISGGIAQGAGFMTNKSVVLGKVYGKGEYQFGLHKPHGPYKVTSQNHWNRYHWQLSKSSATRRSGWEQLKAWRIVRISKPFAR